MANFTQQVIEKTFMEMLDETPLSQITVKELAARCNINRNSFYYHYKDIPALIEKIFLDEMNQTLSLAKDLDSLEQCFNHLIEYSLNHKRAVMHIFKSVSRDIFEGYLMRMCKETIDKYLDKRCEDMKMLSQDRNLLSNGLVCWVFGAVILWLESGMREEDLNSFVEMNYVFSDITDKIYEKFEQRYEEMK